MSRAMYVFVLFLSWSALADDPSAPIISESDLDEAKPVFEVEFKEPNGPPELDPVNPFQAEVPDIKLEEDDPNIPRDESEEDGTKLLELTEGKSGALAAVKGEVEFESDVPSAGPSEVPGLTLEDEIGLPLPKKKRRRGSAGRAILSGPVPIPMPERKPVCVFECTVDLAVKTTNDAVFKEASTMWVQVQGAGLNTCQCPTTRQVETSQTCPVSYPGESAEVTVPCEY